MQSIVDEAAGLAETPIAAVSLVMGTIQYFRAHHGLPPELQAARATSRADSFCQFVVQNEGSFLVEAASEDERVPQNLVERYGIESYLGVPVVVGGELAGSLCVIDVEQRNFPSTLAPKLAELASRVSARLETLSAEPDPDPEPLPVLDNAKNLAFQARLLERAMMEVGPLIRVGEALSTGEISPEEGARVTSVLTEAAPMFELLIRESRQLRSASAKLVEQIEAGT